MDSNDLSIAIDYLNRKIADLDIKIIKNKTEEIENELNKYLKIRKEIYNGNNELIKKIINDEI